MTPATEVADVGSSEPVEFTDDLVQELDSLDDLEGASDDPIADEAAEAAQPEPDAEPALAESPPAEAEVPPDSTTPEPEPLKALMDAASPLTFTVNGEARTLEGILELKGGGALVPPEHIDRFKSTLSLAERSIADNKVLYAEKQEWERLGGTQKVAELEERVAMLDAAGTKLLALLEDPTQLLMLDADGNVVKNPRAVEMLTRDLQMSSKEAAWEKRQAFASQKSEVQQSTQEGQQQEAALDRYISQIGQHYPNLTPADLTAAKQHFGQFRGALFRKATPDDAQQYGFRIGELLIDTPKMAPWFQERDSLRATTKAELTARQQAEKENAARTKAPPKSVPRATPKADQPRAKDGTFMEKQMDKDAQRAAQRRALNRGQFYASASQDQDV